ncbi:hypothetical protein [Streptomyces sp. NRRL B-24720]|uniref:hypothetical protein n=1 Tax=Streptomyces sp. NRRL B-24720 TaxID=1476876 RepID=UPI00131D36CC|nr:hypothetical protein [Streptomyces sp. NRRL B-24720]
MTDSSEIALRPPNSSNSRSASVLDQRGDQLMVDGLEGESSGCRWHVQPQAGQFGLRQQAAAPIEGGREGP